jgi:hypothetical protein
LGSRKKFLPKTLDKPQRICDTSVTEANAGETNRTSAKLLEVSATAFTQVRTLTTQEWKAEQQLGEPVETTRGVSSSCQFCELAKQQALAWIATY